MNPELEEGKQLQLDFKKLATMTDQVVPVVVQHADTQEVLILAYANAEALDYSLKHRKAAFWSTSRHELWVKGATSGDTLDIVEIRVNCEQNSLLYQVRPTKGVCHTQDESGNTRKTCFYRRLDGQKTLRLAMLEKCPKGPFLG